MYATPIQPDQAERRNEYAARARDLLHEALTDRRPEAAQVFNDGIVSLRSSFQLNCVDRRRVRLAV